MTDFYTITRINYGSSIVKDFNAAAKILKAAEGVEISQRFPDNGQFIIKATSNQAVNEVMRSLPGWMQEKNNGDFGNGFPVDFHLG